VIFNPDFKGPLTFCRPGRRGSKAKSQNEGQGPSANATPQWLKDSSNSLFLRVPFFPTGARASRPASSALMTASARL
jgi:hypothetical protein